MIGIVTDIDEKTCKVRVTFPDRDDGNGKLLVSDWLPVGQRKSLGDLDYWLPDLDTQVACQMDDRCEAGVVLCAIYNDADPPPVTDKDLCYRRFKDGSWFQYDRREHKLTAYVKGDVQLDVTGDVVATIDGNVTARVGGNVDATVDGDATAQVGGDVTASVAGSLTATVEGDVTAQVGGSANASIAGTLTAEITGETFITTPTLTLTGELVVIGGITSMASIMAMRNVSDMGGLETMARMRHIFNIHQHQEHGEGGGTTDPPVPQMDGSDN